MKLLRKTLTLMLILSMILTLGTATAFAAETDISIEQSENDILPEEDAVAEVMSTEEIVAAEADTDVVSVTAAEFMDDADESETEPEADSSDNTVDVDSPVPEGLTRVLVYYEFTNEDGSVTVVRLDAFNVDLSQGADFPISSTVDQYDVIANPNMYWEGEVLVVKMPLKLSEFGTGTEELEAPEDFTALYSFPSGEGAAAGTSGVMRINDDYVWCYQPGVPTKNGAMYTKEVIPEDVKKAITTYIGMTYITRNPLAKEDFVYSVIQGLVWEDDGLALVENMQRWDADRTSFVPLTDAEKVQFNEILSLVKTAYDDYISEHAPEIKVDDKAVEDNTITLTKDVDKTVTITIDKKFLEYYNNGQIVFPEGITGVVDTEAGTLTLTLSDSLEAGQTYTIRMSMIPENGVGDSYVFNSNVNNQGLKQYRLQDANLYDLQLVLKEAPKDPEEPTDPEDPEDPEKPTDSEDPEPEKPTDPEDPEPEKPADPAQQEETPDPEKPVTPTHTNVVQTSSAPKTGDSTPIETVILTMVISMGAFSVVILKRRKSF